MEQNYIIINNWKIAVEGDIDIENSSPLSDKTYVYYAGNKIPSRGQSTMPFPITLSANDLAQIGFPHILTNSAANNIRYTGVQLFSCGTLVFKGTMIFTSMRRNLNTGGCKCEAFLFDPLTDFVNAINSKKVSDLAMDGVRQISDHYVPTGPAYPAVPEPIVCLNLTITYPQSAGVSGGVMTIEMLDGYDNAANPCDLMGTATAQYAAQIALNGDPMLCFPTVKVIDSSNGDSWLNYWDHDLSQYPSVGVCPDQTSGLEIFGTNIYQDYGNHIVPMYYYWQVITHCITEFGYTLKDPDGLLGDPHFMRLVLINNFDILNALTLTFTNQDGSHPRVIGYWQCDTVIDPKNHLPSDPIQEFLLDFMQKFNCYFEFDNSDVYLRRGNFNTIDRELSDINPNITIENTIDTGLTIEYDFPDDAQYALVQKVKDMTDYLGTTKVFAAGLNSVVPASAFANRPTPAVANLYYGILYEDCEKLEFVIDGTPPDTLVSGGDNQYILPATYPQRVYMDNVLPLTLGVDVRPDSPSVNLQEVDGANSNAFSLKYPPISQINYDMPDIDNQTEYDMGSWNVLTSSISTIALPGTSFAVSGVPTWAVGNVISITIDKALCIVTGYEVQIHSYIPPGNIYMGEFIAHGTVDAYNNDTGALTFTCTYMGAAPATVGGYYYFPGSSTYFYDLSGASILGFPWDNWKITISRQNILSYVPVPVMKAPVVTYGTQAFTLTPLFTRTAVQGGWAAVAWSDGTNTLNSGPWQPLAGGAFMPVGWITRAQSAVFECGFYWGLQALYNADTSTNVPTGSPFSTLFTEGPTIPAMTGYECIYGNPDVPAGWFNLSLHGRLSLPGIFWQGFINQFIYNRKVTVTVYEAIYDTLQHKFYQSVLIRGTRVYITQINPIIPYRKHGVEYIGYLI